MSPGRTGHGLVAARSCLAAHPAGMLWGPPCVQWSCFPRVADPWEPSPPLQAPLATDTGCVHGWLCSGPRGTSPAPPPPGPGVMHLRPVTSLGIRVQRSCNDHGSVVLPCFLPLGPGALPGNPESTGHMCPECSQVLLPTAAGSASPSELVPSGEPSPVILVPGPCPRALLGCMEGERASADPNP